MYRELLSSYMQMRSVSWRMSKKHNKVLLPDEFFAPLQLPEKHGVSNYSFPPNLAD